jgi:hypothetical protein
LAFLVADTYAENVASSDSIAFNFGDNIADSVSTSDSLTLIKQSVSNSVFNTIALNVAPVN